MNLKQKGILIMEMLKSIRMAMVALLLFVSAAAVADDYAYLSIAQSDGTVVSFTAQGLEMTFANGVATVTSGSTTKTLTLSELTGMSFSNEDGTVGIADVTTATDDTVAVWTTSGVYLGTFAKADMQNRLQRGIYVVKTNGRTQKIVIK